MSVFGAACAESAVISTRKGYLALRAGVLGAPRRGLGACGFVMRCGSVGAGRAVPRAPKSRRFAAPGQESEPRASEEQRQAVARTPREGATPEPREEAAPRS
ncbi:hypothetical protein GCM10010306_042180 [Streptomyces umbrinus]|nr:hypothetical protein GCM10010306_042180 [Streptomyces umbrinus]GHH53681.1 hypothetical protein GCM10018775_55910 [Streptomyces umbrinus]